jgi:hypothetical protein
MAASLHNFIDRHNILVGLTKKFQEVFSKSPTLYKVVLVANHLFRAAMMFTLLKCLPLSWPINGAVCLLGSFFYRLTVENNCAYKFALPSFAGGLAIAVLASAKAIFLPLSLLPSIAYGAYIVLTVSYDVDAKMKRS